MHDDKGLFSERHNIPYVVTEQQGTGLREVKTRTAGEAEDFTVLAGDVNTPVRSGERAILV